MLEPAITENPVMMFYDDVVDALHKAVIDRGEDYVHQGRCEYFDQAGSPRCIVGHVLAQFGVAPFKWDSMANVIGVGGLLTSGVIADMQTPMLLGSTFDSDSYYNAVTSSRVYRVLRNAQHYQDHGHAWGEAVENAINTMTERSKRGSLQW